MPVSNAQGMVEQKQVVIRPTSNNQRCNQWFICNLITALKYIYWQNEKKSTTKTNYLAPQLSFAQLFWSVHTAPIFPLMLNLLMIS